MKNDLTHKFLLSPILKKALEEANLSIHKHRVSAVIFKGNRIITSAHNEVRANSVPHKFRNFPEGLHAECSAIKKVKKDLKGYSILVIRLNSTGDKLLLAKPCCQCQAFIDYVGISKIYYSDNEGRIIKHER